jgi:chorismate mutase / prephenate dehydrogenase
MDVASRVAHESPELYFEIQSLNEYGRESLEALQGALSRLVSAVEKRDAGAFTSLMERGREYFDVRAQTRTD